MLQYNSAHPDDPIEKTADISVKIVQPATRRLPKGHQAFVNIDDGKYRGKPAFFISHTWKARAKALVEAILQHAARVVSEGGPPPVYYLDVVSVDQHMTDQVSALAR